jgi:hypothetical protein
MRQRAATIESLPAAFEVVIGGSLSYAGVLTVVAVPKESVWSLTLSDSPNPRLADPSISVSDRMAALERNMRRRQLVLLSQKVAGDCNLESVN